MPTPTIEKRPISELIQGEWHTRQEYYDSQGWWTWISGVLSIAGDSYTYEPMEQFSRIPVESPINILFAHPTGKIAIDYAAGVTPNDDFNEFAHGDDLASLVFRADSEISVKFLIRVLDSTSLIFDKPPEEGMKWSVTKDIGADSGQ